MYSCVAQKLAQTLQGLCVTNGKRVLSPLGDRQVMRDVILMAPEPFGAFLGAEGRAGCLECRERIVLSMMPPIKARGEGR